MRFPRVRGVLVVAVLLLVPSVASAHALGGSRFDAPVPLPLLLGGAGATVGVTALWLGRTGREADPRTLGLGVVPARVARGLETGFRGAFLLVVLGAVLHGLVGRQVAAGNAATLFVWPVWFRGVALLVLLVGNVWPVLSPWRTVYEGLVALEGDEIAALGAYPRRLGAWPATVGFLALLGVAENLSATPRSPRLTAGLVAVYGLVMVVGAVCFGPVWFRRADPLGAFYRLFARVSPVETARTPSGVAVVARPPWNGCLDPVRENGLVALVVASVYTVSFDGLASTSAFQTVLYAVRDALGTGRFSGIILYLLGFAGFVAVFLATTRAVERLGRSERTAGRADVETARSADTAERDDAGTVGRSDAARAFAPTVLPIAAAYEVAHNYPYVVRSLGRLVGVALDPVRPGLTIEALAWLPLPAFWGSQVALIVAGHLVAVVAAHYVSVERYGSERAARAHLPLVALMVGYTVLSLWIVSRPVVAA